MPQQVVIDTTVLQKANAPITPGHRMGRTFARRVALLQEVRDGQKIVLFSRQLVAEYRRKIPQPRNDFIIAFFALLTVRTHAIENWSPWPSRYREKARRCRFPVEDDRVLRTALGRGPATIICEEQRMIAANACIYREFRVHIRGI